jgi:hypothetical protein
MNEGPLVCGTYILWVCQEPGCGEWDKDPGEHHGEPMVDVYVTPMAEHRQPGMRVLTREVWGENPEAWRCGR